MNVTNWPLIAVLAMCASASTSSAADIDRQIRLPVLTVSGDPPSGRLSYVRFQCLRRDGDRTPLSIAVVEDTPGGAGESIRASLWQAAMVAALERKDDLSGVRLSLELSGQVDGPSAGAALCLAILSALDGRDFPTDAAATGAIMPDGTIGGVGALTEKLRAAAKGGVRRVLVPAYIRFDLDPRTGTEIDLKRLAESLNVDLIPTENVARAYRSLHRDALIAVTPPDRKVLELSPVTEEVLKRQYQEARREGIELWDAIPQAERDDIIAEPALKRIFIHMPAEAERAFRSGRLIRSAATISAWRSALSARKRYQASLATIDPGPFKRQDIAGMLDQLDPILRRTADSLPPLADVLAKNEREWPESAAQFYADYHGLYGEFGMSTVVQQTVEALASESVGAELEPNDRRAYWEALLECKILQMFLVQWAVSEIEAWPVATDEVVVTLPTRSAADDVAAVERLFYSAHLAVENSFHQDFVQSTAMMLETTAAETFDRLTANDEILARHRAPVVVAQRLHDALPGIDDLHRRRFATTASAHLQAECLAVMSGLAIRWQALAVELDDDGGFHYGRTDLLYYLITTARENALTAIADCRALEIPCVRPIGRFEEGESSRDDVATDKIDVLIAYWSATLQAKALLMLCSETANESPRSQPAVAPAGPPPIGASPFPQPSATGHRPPRSPLEELLNGRRPPPRQQPDFVPIRRPAPLMPVVPKPAPQPGGGEKGLAAAIIALGVGCWAFLRKLFGRTKRETKPTTETDGEVKT